jgi:hypothetical protein
MIEMEDGSQCLFFAFLLTTFPPLHVQQLVAHLVDRVEVRDQQHAQAADIVAPFALLEQHFRLPDQQAFILGKYSTII